MLYTNPVSNDVRLSPTYDLVNTTMYIAKDTLALKLDKSKAWPTLKQLVEYGQQHCLVDRPLEDIERISAAVMDYRPTEQTTISSVEFGFKLSRRFGLNLARQKAAFVQIG